MPRTVEADPPSTDDADAVVESPWRPPVAGLLTQPPYRNAVVVMATAVTMVSIFAVSQTLALRWAFIPTWGLFVAIGNVASGGAVAPPLLPGSPTLSSYCWSPPGAVAGRPAPAEHAQPRSAPPSPGGRWLLD